MSKGNKNKKMSLGEFLGASNYSTTGRLPTAPRREEEDSYDDVPGRGGDSWRGGDESGRGGFRGGREEGDSYYQGGGGARFGGGFSRSSRDDFHHSDDRFGDRPRQQYNSEGRSYGGGGRYGDRGDHGDRDRYDSWGGGSSGRYSSRDRRDDDLQDQSAMERPAHMRLNLKKREAPLPVVQQHEEAPSASSPSAQAHQEGNSDAMKERSGDGSAAVDAGHIDPVAKSRADKWSAVEARLRGGAGGGRRY